MITTLVVQHEQYKRELSKISLQHADWDLVETDNYNEALERIQSGSIDALAVPAEMSAGGCMGLVSSLQNEKPGANVYIMMDNNAKVDRSKSIDRGFIYV